MALLQQIPSEFKEYLVSFLVHTHPTDKDNLYHNIFHSFEVLELVTHILKHVDTFDKWEILVQVAALFHDLDPERQPNTPPSVARTLHYLEHNSDANSIIRFLCDLFGFNPQQVNTLILATDYSENPEERKRKWDLFCQECLIHFKEVNTAILLGRILAYADKAATQILLPVNVTAQRIKGLAFELRTLNNSQHPTDTEMWAGTSSFITSELIDNDMFHYLPVNYRRRLEQNRIFFTEFI